MIQIAITDDKPQILRALSSALSFFPDIEILFTARHGQDAIDKISASGKKPQVMLMDIEMDAMDGITATGRIKQQWPEIQILMLTVLDTEDKIFQAVMAGASGYLLKEEQPERLLQSIRDAHEGRLAMSPLIAAKALSLLRQGPKQENYLKVSDFQLSEREVEILELVAQGKNYKQIAEKLFISPKTVRNHTHNIHQKLQVNSKTEAVNIALRNKWF